MQERAHTKNGQKKNKRTLLSEHHGNMNAIEILIGLLAQFTDTKSEEEEEAKEEYCTHHHPISKNLYQRTYHLRKTKSCHQRTSGRLKTVWLNFTGTCNICRPCPSGLHDILESFLDVAPGLGWHFRW
jgi:hypothetical protein